MPASPAPSTRGGAASACEKCHGEADNLWNASALHKGSNKSVSPQASAAPSSASHDLDSVSGPLANASVDYGKRSWSFMAHMLDGIQAHLCSPFLRPITVRYAIILHARHLRFFEGLCAAFYVVGSEAAIPGCLARGNNQRMVVFNALLVLCRYLV